MHHHELKTRRSKTQFFKIKRGPSVNGGTSFDLYLLLLKPVFSPGFPAGF